MKPQLVRVVIIKSIVTGFAAPVTRYEVKKILSSRRSPSGCINIVQKALLFDLSIG
jgi:hypothetical protein